MQPILQISPLKVLVQSCKAEVERKTSEINEHQATLPTLQEELSKK